MMMLRQRLVEALLKYALRARGYHGHGRRRSLQYTGEVAFIERLGRSGAALCIDVGANVGEYSEALLARTDATVMAFEPQPTPYRLLARLATQYPHRFTAINCGVADRCGELELHWGQDSGLASFSAEVNAIEDVGQNNVNQLRVPVTTVDDFLTSVPADMELTLLKVDTEGYEHEVLQGAQRTLEQRRPKFVQIEFNLHQLLRRQTLYSLSRLLKGYRAFQMLPGRQGLLPISPLDPLANVYAFSNFVFERSEGGATSVRRRRDYVHQTDSVL